MKTRALKQQSAVTPEASQCTKGNHVVTGEVFLLDIGLLMGVKMWSEKRKGKNEAWVPKIADVLRSQSTA